MKSKIAGVASVFVLVMALGGPMANLVKFAGFGDGLSFREQLSQLVDQRDSGLISDTTYRFKRKQITGVMMH